MMVNQHFIDKEEMKIIENAVIRQVFDPSEINRNRIALFKRKVEDFQSITYYFIFFLNSIIRDWY